MPQDQQVDDKLDGSLVLVPTGACRQRLHKIGHTECLGQGEQTHRLLRFQHRDVPIINASKLIGAHRSVVRPLNEIENEGNRQNRDHDHQPVPVLAQ